MWFIIILYYVYRGMSLCCVLLCYVAFNFYLYMNDPLAKANYLNKTIKLLKTYEEISSVDDPIFTTNQNKLAALG